MANGDKTKECSTPAQGSLIPEQNKPLKDSPNIKEIDALLLSSLSILKIAGIVKDKFKEDYHVETFRRRRTELRKKVKMATAAIDSVAEIKASEQKSLTYELKTLEQSVVDVMKLEMAPGHPQAKAVGALRTQIESFMRRAAELFGEIDFLAVLRYSINVQHLRVAKMLELEMQMGIPMRDNTENIRVLFELTKGGIEMYKELGLRPKFGDPVENLKANLGSSEQSTGVGLSERQRQLKAMSDELMALPPEQREKRSREMMHELVNRIRGGSARVLEEKVDDTSPLVA